MIPESRFYRPPANIDGQFVITDAYGEQITISQEEVKSRGLQNDAKVDMRPLTLANGLKVWHGASKESVLIALQSYIDMAKCLSSPGVVSLPQVSHSLVAETDATQLWTVAYSGVLLGEPSPLIYLGS